MYKPSFRPSDSPSRALNSLIQHSILSNPATGLGSRSFVPSYQTRWAENHIKLIRRSYIPPPPDNEKDEPAFDRPRNWFYRMLHGLQRLSAKWFPAYDLGLQMPVLMSVFNEFRLNPIPLTGTVAVLGLTVYSSDSGVIFVLGVVSGMGGNLATEYLFFRKRRGKGFVLLVGGKLGGNVSVAYLCEVFGVFGFIVKAQIYVVDSVDQEGIGRAKEEFQYIVKDPFMLNAVILVFANKQDMKGAMTPLQVCNELGLHELDYNRKWHIQGTCALKGEGLYEGFDWLSSTLKDLKANKVVPGADHSVN